MRSTLGKETISGRRVETGGQREKTQPFRTILSPSLQDGDGKESAREDSGQEIAHINLKHLYGGEDSYRIPVNRRDVPINVS
jgi:hypothetical protein